MNTDLIALNSATTKREYERQQELQSLKNMNEYRKIRVDYSKAKRKPVKKCKCK